MSMSKAGQLTLNACGGCFCRVDSDLKARSQVPGTLMQPDMRLPGMGVDLQIANTVTTTWEVVSQGHQKHTCAYRQVPSM